MPEPLANGIVWLLSAIVVLWAVLVVVWLASALRHAVARTRAGPDDADDPRR